ncbi:helix-turn-helix domain-containing protein [Nocardiopsis dassonvillei]
MKPNARPDPAELLTPTEAASMLGIHPKTIGAWANKGRIKCFRTPGGHRRYRRQDVHQALNALVSLGLVKKLGHSQNDRPSDAVDKLCAPKGVQYPAPHDGCRTPTPREDNTDG